MSANVDLVRSIYAAWERGDFSSAGWAHPEIENVSTDSLLPGNRSGVTEMADDWRNWLGAWEDFRVEAEEYRELDAERVLVLAHFSGRGKTSGLDVGEMRARGASLFHLKGGNVTRLVLYLDRERALADLSIESRGGAAGPSQ